MNVKIVATKEEREDAYLVRTKVFIDEQNVPVEEEIDKHEHESTHFVLYDDVHSPIGAGRFRILDGIGKVERICVLSSARQKGSGIRIMDAIQTFAASRDITRLKLNAQTHAIPFYEKLGYQTVSGEFLDAGIPHKTMIKEI
ncbi:GNAT family N-acetyltransferase [Peribacillus cavernae]|uniref:GNAT family N-acetyltransferase n=1 Tax=Peribacillus cavernae TaxID=1674310 RepID=A0A3S0VE15_9BACI|nr:GNAT family N-acetyltransferase [Peribacillus cavernae]MDQ0217457.1 putative GNAT family N-acyltransferase [Peribacillus cavernae]RUQ30099.1 GNAT family N-acetyltransferase [Peribacillus cavernae]